MPLHVAPRRYPHVPYSCPGLRDLSVVCEGDEREIKRILSHTPFSYVSNRFIIGIADFTNSDPEPFYDVGVIVPAKFCDIVGGYWAYEYEDNPDSVISGRERWGYPKRFGTTKFRERGNIVMATVARYDVKLIDIKLELDGSQAPPAVQTYPHLLLQAFPRPDGPGVFLKRVLLRDTSPDFVMKSSKTGKATVSVGKSDLDPIYKLEPIKVLGGTFTVGDFLATDKPGHGWAKVLETLTP